MSDVIHAPGIQTGGEFTLCGDALDAFETGDAPAPIVIAQPSQTVTCKACRREIEYVRNAFGPGFIFQGGRS